MLPADFKIGTGKIVDNEGNQSAETDLILYNKAVLPPVMYSERDGVFPVESSYYAIEVKSRLTAAELQDAIRKGRSITALSYLGKQQGEFQHRAPTATVLFAFGTDLAEGSSEIERYAQYDHGWLRDPVIKAICVVGRGYWYHRAEAGDWVSSEASPQYDEVIELVSGVVNTVVKNPFFTRAALLGHYLMQTRPVTFVTEKNMVVPPSLERGIK